MINYNRIDKLYHVYRFLVTYSKQIHANIDLNATHKITKTHTPKMLIQKSQLITHTLIY